MKIFTAVQSLSNVGFYKTYNADWGKALARKLQTNIFWQLDSASIKVKTLDKETKGCRSQVLDG